MEGAQTRFLVSLSSLRLTPISSLPSPSPSFRSPSLSSERALPPHPTANRPTATLPLAQTAPSAPPSRPPSRRGSQTNGPSPPPFEEITLAPRPPTITSPPRSPTRRRTLKHSSQITPGCPSTTVNSSPSPLPRLPTTQTPTHPPPPLTQTRHPPHPPPTNSTIITSTTSTTSRCSKITLPPTPTNRPSLPNRPSTNRQPPSLLSRSPKLRPLSGWQSSRRGSPRSTQTLIRPRLRRTPGPSLPVSPKSGRRLASTLSRTLLSRERTSYPSIARLSRIDF
jgi:hypothetical protein